MPRAPRGARTWPPAWPPALPRAGRHTLRRLGPLAAPLAALLALLVLPGLLPLPVYEVQLEAVLLPPSALHPLGTDENGRDALARLLAGARTTLGIATAGAALAVLLGTVLGAGAGYAGGVWDTLLMRAVDIALAFPSLFAILLFSALVRPGPGQLVLLIGLTGWMGVTRLVRGEVRSLAARPFVEAARAAGAGPWRVVWRHVVPNLAGVLFVATLVQLNRAVLAEATISFLGLGIQPPDPTWGNLLIGAQDYLYTAPWLALGPGIAITLTLLWTYRLGLAPATAPWATPRGPRESHGGRGRAGPGARGR